MTQIIIRDFQVVERADIALGGITIVGGKNSQGKSSIAKGAAAVATGHIQFGLTKKDGKRLVRDGREVAAATLKSDNGAARANWPKCEFSTEGTPLAISAIAAGLEHLLDLSESKAGLAERAQILGRLLRTDPTREDFEQACADAEIPKDITARLWADIEALGWDGKFDDVKKKGANFKGRWEQVAGEAYGPEKAKSWTPAGWTDDLADASLDDLHAEVGEAQQDVERAVAGQAVDQAEIDRLTSACAEIEVLSAASTDAQVAATQTEAAHKAAQRERDALPPGDQPHSLTCPSCKAAVQLAGAPGAQHLTLAAVIPDAELKKRRMAIASADGKLSKATGELDAANRKAADAQRAFQDAQAAQTKLREMQGKNSAAGGGLQEARDRLALAQRRHNALKAKHDADQIAGALAMNAKVQVLLAPDGVRKTKLLRVLDTFNGGPLAELCAAAGFAAVRIEPDMTVAFGGRPYPLLAGLGPQLSSDQFRVRAILQVALAQIQGDGLVIIDAADVLDQSGRNGLIKMLRAAGQDALVCMTFSKPDLVPDLEKHGFGRAYWVEGGVARPLAAVLPAKEAA